MNNHVEEKKTQEPEPKSDQRFCLLKTVLAN